MFAKVFAQIFDSSIAENYEVRHVFEDLLKLADKTGVVDMTQEAISRRTNIPFEKVKYAIAELMKEDERSRSKEHGGRRIIPLDSRRDWGWIIVNYEHYRSIQDEETRREFWRNAKAKQRSKKPKRLRGDLGGVSPTYRARERRYVEAENNGNQEKADEIAAEL